MNFRFQYGKFLLIMHLKQKLSLILNDDVP
jgi:hypothetical protein